MVNVLDNAIEFTPIWIWCNRCNKRVKIKGIRSCLDKGSPILVVDIEHDCSNKSS
jgi:hypothetical protein